MMGKMLALAMPLALAGPGPGAEKLFGNWAVVCDNVKRCEATVLMPGNWSGGTPPGLDFAREAGPAGAVTITVTPLTEAPGLIDILIDRRLMGSGVIRDHKVHLTGATAEGLARAMANGRVLTLKARRAVLATISLGGASAAMRYIDAEQGRGGGVTALVARGPKSAAAVPAAMAVPRVPAVRPGNGKARVTTLTPALADQLRTRADCGGYEVNERLSVIFHRLDGHSTLVLMPCITDTYQAVSAAFVATDGEWRAAQFDDMPGRGGAERPMVARLVDPEWNPAQGVLSSHAKGQGAGDCGIDRHWVWDGSRFRMTLSNGLEICRISGAWLTRYRAEPVYK